MSWICSLDDKRGLNEESILVGVCLGLKVEYGRSGDCC